jgi:CBS domain-containing protein
MTEDVVICRPTDWLHDVWSIMKERRLKNIPVTDAESRPIGVLNARDALEALMLEVEQEETLLRDYVMCVGYR